MLGLVDVGHRHARHRRLLNYPHGLERLQRGGAAPPAEGWSQKTLGFDCALHRTFVAHVELQARNIALDNVERLALALGVQTYERHLAPA
jgi:hypothetical protein